MNGFTFSSSQFHYGSIKTTYEKQKLDEPVSCLNSTMVRLKRYRVKAMDDSSNGLNSTMVRLKQIKHSPTKHRRVRSQFHYGSIKTLRNIVG